MNIIVVGCGKVGTTILENLVEEGHNVTAVDLRPSALADITNIHDVITVCGNGADSDTLEEAGVGQAGLVVAATGSDEVNMLCCYLAGKMGAADTVARIRKPEYNDRSLPTMKQHLNLSMAINPDRLAAKEMYHLLRLPDVLGGGFREAVFPQQTLDGAPSEGPGGIAQGIYILPVQFFCQIVQQGGILADALGGGAESCGDAGIFVPQQGHHMMPQPVA